MRATIKIEMDNAAFEDEGELPRILRKLADDMEENPYDIGNVLLDINGNVVGELKIAGKRR